MKVASTTGKSLTPVGGSQMKDKRLCYLFEVYL